MRNVVSAEQRVIELEAELQQLRRETQGFTSALSHDLRAPLRHIVSYARLLAEEAGAALDVEQRSFLGTITESAEHMGAMLDALRELARIGTAPLALAPLSPEAVVHEVWAELAARHAPRTLAFAVAPGIPSARVDAALLRVALHAVLDNAWKFTSQMPAGTERVELAWSVANGGLQISVRDNGCGFRAAQPGMALEMFGRLHAARPYGGLGAGLAWAAKALARMGGTVALESTDAGGCVATIQIPQ